jgi:tRNA A37 threonylcarbamoyladenosine modification protein TsaB
VHLNLPNASDLLEICINKLEKMEVLDPSHLLPIYLSGEEQWRQS